MPKLCERFDKLGADGAPARLGIMGGTFDPIHLGHLRIAEEVREALALDAVLFMPAGNPVFKRDQHVTDAHERLAQVRCAIRDNPHFDVSALEVEREGATYTVDTLRQLRAHFPDCVEIFFIIGSDAAESIGKWRASAEIAELADLAVAVGRPGFAGEDELRTTIAEAGPFRLHLVQVSALEISSSDIRARRAEGKSLRYLVPDCLLSPDGCNLVQFSSTAEAPFTPGDETVGINGESQPADASPEVLSKDFYKARKAELKQRVGHRRFEHSIGVSRACVDLAKRYGVDVRKARLAGLLHDWDKALDDEGIRKRVRDLGMTGELDPWVVENMPRVLHGHTAARALARDFPDIPADVLQAISRHTTAARDMDPLDMVLYIADAIEESRHFGRIEELRAQVGVLDLEELYFQTYEYWTFLLLERRQPLHPDTMRIWNANVLRNAEIRRARQEAGASSDAKG